MFLAALVSVAICAGWSVVTSQFFLGREDAGKDPMGQFSLLLRDPPISLIYISSL